MDVEEFREQGKKLIDFTYELRKNYANRRVTPAIQKGFLQKIMSGELIQSIEIIEFCFI